MEEDSDQDEYHDVGSPPVDVGDPEIKVLPDPTDSGYGFHVVTSMSESDLHQFLNKLQAEAPVLDNLSANTRTKKMNWSKITFDAYNESMVEAAWEYLKSHTRKFRIMAEIVQEIKLVTEKDSNKFRLKLIESSPEFPRRPPANGAQMFCREMWEMNDDKKNFVLVNDFSFSL